MSPTAKKILRALRKSPATASQLSEITGMTRQYVGQVIAELRKNPKKIHVSGWVGILSREEAVFSIGKDEDAKKPASAQEIVLRTMQEKMIPMTINELADACGLTPQTTGRCVNRIALSTPVRIAEWLVIRGPHTPRYVLGEGVDAKKPDPMTPLERVHRYRATPKGKKTTAKCARRWRKSVEGKEYARRKYNAKVVRDQLENRGLSSIDPLLAAIMGVR